MKKIIIIILLPVILYSLIVLGQLLAIIYPGPVSKNVQEKVTQGIEKIKEDIDLTGQIEIVDIYKSGALTEAAVTYSEIIDNQKISIDNTFLFNKDGSMYTNTPHEKSTLAKN